MFRRVLNYGSLIIAGILFLVTFLVSAQQPFDLTIFRDENNLTIYLPGSGAVSILDMTLEADGIAHTLATYPSVRSFHANSIPRPICFRLQRSGDTTPLTGACPPALTITEILPNAEVFWHNQTTGTDSTILVTNSVETLGFCPAGQSECHLTFVALTPTPPPPTVTPTSLPPPTPTEGIDQCFLYGLGVNYPWRNYGHDFGEAWTPHDGAGTYQQQLDADFAYLKEHGVETVRWFLFADGRAAPEFNDDGDVTGFDEYFFVDVDTVIAVAQKYDIYLIFVLFDFHLAESAQVISGVQTGGRANLITDSHVQDTFIENALRPLIERYGGYRHIFAWEVINEPEWVMRIPGRETVEGFDMVSVSQMQSFVTRLADFINANTNQWVTLGSASRNSMIEYWTNSGLDFYQFHYYEAMEDQNPIDYPALALGLDQPIVVGEFPTAQTSRSMADYLYTIARNNYAGAWAWSYNAGDEFSDFSTAASEYASANYHCPHMNLPALENTTLFDFEDGTDMGWGVYADTVIHPLSSSETNVNGTQPVLGTPTAVGSSEPTVVPLALGEISEEVAHDSRYSLQSRVIQTSPDHPNARKILLAVPFSEDLSGATISAWVYLPEGDPTIYFADTKLFLFNDRWCWFESATPRIDYESCDPRVPFVGREGIHLRPGSWVQVTWQLGNVEWTRSWQDIVGIQIWIESTFPYDGVIYVDDIMIEHP